MITTSTYMQLPNVCDFQEAKYSISVYNEHQESIYQSKEETYNKDSPHFVNATIRLRMLEHKKYTAKIRVSTVVQTTTRRLKLVKLMYSILHHSEFKIKSYRITS